MDCSAAALKLDRGALKAPMVILEGMVAFGGQTLNGGDFLVAKGGNRQLARPDSIAIHVHGTGPALRHATTVFGTWQVQVIPQNPQDWRGGVHFYLANFPVDFYIKFCHRIIVFLNDKIVVQEPLSAFVLLPTQKSLLFSLK